MGSPEETKLSAWMRQSQDGDAAAYEALLRAVSELLTPFVRGFLRRRALWAVGSQDDILQEILMALHTKRHTYNPAQPFLPWLYAVARYRIIDTLRAGAKHRTLVEFDEELARAPTEDSGGPSPEERVLARSETRELIARLPEKQRRLLELVKLEGLSIREASARTGYSSSDIKVSVHRALKQLRESLRESGKPALKPKELS